MVQHMSDKGGLAVDVSRKLRRKEPHCHKCENHCFEFYETSDRQ